MLIARCSLEVAARGEPPACAASRWCSMLVPVSMTAEFDADRGDDKAEAAETTIELIGRAQRGDRRALDDLMRRFLPRVRRWAAGRVPAAVRDLADTSDLVQDVLLQTFQRVDALELGRQGGLQAYLRRAVLNRIRDEFRRSQRRPEATTLESEHPAKGPSPLEAAIGRQALDRYEAALAALRPLDREAIIARIEMGCSYDEVARLIGKPTANAARMAVERALVRLVEHLRP
jgi:RNA polymerase sigma-70 factor, ECF subfamily